MMHVFTSTTYQTVAVNLLSLLTLFLMLFLMPLSSSKVNIVIFVK